MQMAASRIGAQELPKFVAWVEHRVERASADGGGFL